MPESTRAGRRRLSRLLQWRADRPLALEDVSSRTTAFVYGNILVLAALVALHPEDLLSSKAVAYVVGTGVSTFVAHVLAESIGHGIRSDVRRPSGHLRREIWDAVPIASSVLTPALLMIAALVEWLEPDVALQLAVLVTVLRLASLGWVVGHLRGERASVRTFLAGVLLAAVCLVAALLKAFLTH
jgi:VIT1/CCC1 family predicted Fe2+/Mn2+ transporter